MCIWNLDSGNFKNINTLLFFDIFDNATNDVKWENESILEDWNKTRA